MRLNQHTLQVMCLAREQATLYMGETAVVLGWKGLILEFRSAFLSSTWSEAVLHRTSSYIGNQTRFPMNDNSTCQEGSTGIYEEPVTLKRTRYSDRKRKY